MVHPTFDDIQGKSFPVLDKGSIVLVDCMGSDQDICQAARVSYGTGTRSVSDDRTLIRYLMRCRHTSPFEQAELKFLVSCPMDVWRQWIRHRTASVNEYSTRYSEAIDERQETAKNEWRLQSIANKQGSGGFVSEWPEGYRFNSETNFLEMDDGSGNWDADSWPASAHCKTPGRYLTNAETEFHEMAKRLYEERLKFGVAREQARKDLPLSTYTSAYWKIDLHNLFHFLSLRMDSHAQLEIRQYANAIGEIVKQLFPISWEAFEDYRLNATALSALDIEAIRIAAGIMKSKMEIADTDRLVAHITNKREREECLEKLKRLGVL